MSTFTCQVITNTIKCSSPTHNVLGENVTPLCGPANIPCMEKARRTSFMIGLINLEFSFQLSFRIKFFHKTIRFVQWIACRSVLACIMM